MNNNIDFQIVCIDCGCLGIRIEDPLKASREAIVYCGDCGASRGTMGALRDLAVQSNAEVKLPMRPWVSPRTGGRRLIRNPMGKSQNGTASYKVFVNRLKLQNPLHASPRGG